VLFHKVLVDELGKNVCLFHRGVHDGDVAIVDVPLETIQVFEIGSLVIYIEYIDGLEKIIDVTRCP